MIVKIYGTRQHTHTENSGVFPGRGRVHLNYHGLPFHLLKLYDDMLTHQIVSITENRAWELCPSFQDKFVPWFTSTRRFVLIQF